MPDQTTYTLFSAAYYTSINQATNYYDVYSFGNIGTALNASPYQSSFSSITITSSSLLTGSTGTFNFGIILKNAISKDGYIVLTLPSDIVLPTAT